jgi:hypothetical protein
MILMRAPEAKKPVTSIINRTTRGKFVLSGNPEAVDLVRLTKKKRVPANMALPKRSRSRERSPARRWGMAKPNWARITMRRGMATPQNSMRWAAPLVRFLRILL